VLVVLSIVSSMASNDPLRLLSRAGKIVGRWELGDWRDTPAKFGLH
jgi:hypothetical protein